LVPCSIALGDRAHTLAIAVASTIRSVADSISEWFANASFRKPPSGTHSAENPSRSISCTAGLHCSHGNRAARMLKAPIRPSCTARLADVRAACVAAPSLPAARLQPGAREHAGHEGALAGGIRRDLAPVLLREPQLQRLVLGRERGIDTQRIAEG